MSQGTGPGTYHDYDWTGTYQYGSGHVRSSGYELQLTETSDGNAPQDERANFMDRANGSDFPEDFQGVPFDDPATANTVPNRPMIVINAEGERVMDDAWWEYFVHHEVELVNLGTGMETYWWQVVFRREKRRAHQNEEHTTSEPGKQAPGTPRRETGEETSSSRTPASKQKRHRKGTESEAGSPSPRSNVEDTITPRKKGKLPVVAESPKKSPPKASTSIAKASKRYHRPSEGALRINKARKVPEPAELDDLPDHKLYSHSPPSSVEIRLMGNVVVTSVELMSFFPVHYDWTDYLRRMYHGGWSWQRIAEFIMNVRDEGGSETENLRSNMAKRAARVMGDELKNGTRTPVTNFTCAGWVPSEGEVTEYFVVDLAAGIQRDDFPTGVDRGPLTRTIEYLLDHPEQKISQGLKLSQLAHFVQQKGFEDLAALGMQAGAAVNADNEACNRHGGYPKKKATVAGPSSRPRR